MSKELYIQAHEELVEQYMAEHPGADWNEAYERTADGAWDLARDKLADRADAIRQRMKDAWQ